MNRKSKFWTILFSMVPGAGHMYMGYIKQGTQLMLAFVLLCAIAAYFEFIILGFLIPVLWFYCVFDAYHRYEGTEIKEHTDFDMFDLFTWLQARPNLVAWGLIILGSLMIFDRVLLPLLSTSWMWKYYAKTLIVAGILIYGGVKLLTGTGKQITDHNFSTSAMHIPRASTPSSTGQTDAEEAPADGSAETQPEIDADTEIPHQDEAGNKEQEVKA